MNITKEELKDIIDVAAGRKVADKVIKNAKIVNVYSGNIEEGDIAIVGKWIAGIGSYDGKVEIDAKGRYASPGLIDSHIHIESTYCTPEEFGRMVVPCGTTTVVADPHEIVNVCGLNGLNYMIRSAEKTELSVRYMIPSCVPATPFEDAGAVVNAFDMQWPMMDEHVPGLGEFMNYVGVYEGDSDVLDKIWMTKKLGKMIDGHSPNLSGNNLNAYASAGIKTDHECSTIAEMNDRISRGMYVQMREGSACHNLEVLAKGITKYNYRRILLCSDDRQPKTIFEKGHINHHLRMLVSYGIDPVMAIAMATLNASECYDLLERGAIAPGKRADIVLFDDLVEFNAHSVYIAGEEIARDGRYLIQYDKCDISLVRGSMHVKDFSIDRLKMHLTSDTINAIKIIPGGLITKKEIMKVKISEDGDFVFDPDIDAVKVAVLERHHNTGKIGLAILSGYKMTKGAIALSVAHDSHNIICVGVDNDEMAAAIEALIDQEGGFVLVLDGKVIASLPLPVAGLMSDLSGEEVADRLDLLHSAAHDILGVSKDIEPIMTLTFMSLIVIPEIKVTDRGLFDVAQYKFIELEA